MEAKTALELWTDGVEGRLNLQLYRCDVDSLLHECRGTSPLCLFELDSPSYEESKFDDTLPEDRVLSSLFLDFDSSGGEEVFEDIILEGRVTPPLRLFDHLNSPTYEELIEQNWQLFEGLDQELEISCAHRDVLVDLDLLGSPKAIRSVMPEPTCLTKIIQTMMTYPYSVKKAPRKRKKNNWTRQKKSRPLRRTAITVSVDENDDEVESEVEDSARGIVGCKGFQMPCQPEQPVVESSSSVRCKAREQDASWKSTLGTPAVLPASPIAASAVVPSFTEHLARCAVDWDYPRVLSMGCCEPEPVSQKMAPPQTGETSARPRPGSSSVVLAQPGMAPLALEQKSTPVLGASNGFLWKKRYASSNLSNDTERRLQGPSRNLGLENIEPITELALPQNKRRRLVT